MRDIIAKTGFVGLETTLVLLFLAVEYGRAGQFLSIDAGLMGVTMLMVLVLPYFLPSADSAEQSFGTWITFRGAVMAFGLALGLLLPESMRFMPMTLLLVAAIASCYLQFYGLMKLRLAK